MAETSETTGPLDFATYAALAARTRLPSTLEPPGVYGALEFANEVVELETAWAEGFDCWIEGQRERWKERCACEMGDALWGLAAWAWDRRTLTATVLPADWTEPTHDNPKEAFVFLRRSMSAITAYEKRIIRDGRGELPALAVEGALEAMISLASYGVVPLAEVARRNLAKLAGRAERGTIGGAGDSR
jgi:hypothetical protein